MLYIMWKRNLRRAVHIHPTLRKENSQEEDNKRWKRLRENVHHLNWKHCVYQKVIILWAYEEICISTLNCGCLYYCWTQVGTESYSTLHNQLKGLWSLIYALDVTTAFQTILFLKIVNIFLLIIFILYWYRVGATYLYSLELCKLVNE